ncbi:MAG: lipid A biosynthesis acyltransferase [Burkholderiaceae bacterium]|nr:lipid A biosynthesis acyltransferase [Burkholderiaceae bacterium]
MAARLTIGLLWLLSRLPYRWQAGFSRALGSLLYHLARERRRVGSINLRQCFPALSEKERQDLLKAHFRAFTQAALERGFLWWASREELMQKIRFEDLHHWRDTADRPTILFAPHFVGLDAAGTRIVCEFPGASIYSMQKNRALDGQMRKGRERFGNATLFSRQDGIRPVIRALREVKMLYYLPDLDYGPRDAVFVPFFGVPAATITGLSRLAAVGRARVVPCVTRQLPQGGGYVVRLYPAWENFPSGDEVADARRMNAFIEERVREMPEQYFWLHKRFKTRPPGEARFYA